MSIFATQEQVNILKARALAWQDAGFPSADPRIPDLMRLMNKLENVACVWSCEGHSDPAQLDPKKLKHFYLMMAVTEEGFETVTRLYNKLRIRLFAATELGDIRLANHREDPINDPACAFDDPIAYSPVYRCHLNITSRTWPIATYVDNQPRRPKNYNVVILGGETGYENIKEAFFAELMASLKELLVSYTD